MPWSDVTYNGRRFDRVAARDGPHEHLDLYCSTCLIFEGAICCYDTYCPPTDAEPMASLPPCIRCKAQDTGCSRDGTVIQFHKPLTGSQEAYEAWIKKTQARIAQLDDETLDRCCRQVETPKFHELILEPRPPVPGSLMHHRLALRRATVSERQPAWSGAREELAHLVPFPIRRLCGSTTPTTRPSIRALRTPWTLGNSREHSMQLDLFGRHRASLSPHANRQAAESLMTYETQLACGLAVLRAQPHPSNRKLLDHIILESDCRFTDAIIHWECAFADRLADYEMIVGWSFFGQDVPAYFTIHPRARVIRCMRGTDATSAETIARLVRYQQFKDDDVAPYTLLTDSPVAPPLLVFDMAIDDPEMPARGFVMPSQEVTRRFWYAAQRLVEELWHRERMLWSRIWGD